MRTDRAVMAGLAIAGLLAAFWFLVLSPKREEAGELSERVEQLQASVAEQEQIAAAAEEARDDFDENYQQLVVIGKAVPEDEDTSSLLVQLEQVAETSEVEFEAIRLQSAGGADAAAAPGPEQTTADGAESGTDSSDGDDEAAEAPPEPAVPTEPAVAGLPLGASVGPAGLPVMPYTISITGDFFEIADFLSGLDSLVRPKDDRPRVRGRLVTIDGFSLTADDADGFPTLDAELAVTTFVTPREQGLTAGSSPTGPAPGEPAPASDTTTTTTATP